MAKDPVEGAISSKRAALSSAKGLKKPDGVI
jgi:hypothetical protein